MTPSPDPVAALRPGGLPAVDDPSALASWLGARLPHSARVLDLHCGGGERLQALVAGGLGLLHGIDGDALAIARARRTGGSGSRVWVDDSMVPEAVPRRDYDAILAIDLPEPAGDIEASLVARAAALLGVAGLLVLRTKASAASLCSAATAAGLVPTGVAGPDMAGRTTCVLQRCVRPQVLVVVDVDGWAHAHKAAAIAAHLAEEFDVVPCLHRELTAQRLDAADLVVVFYWQQLAGSPEVQAAFARNEHKLLLGVCSHAELEGGQGPQALAVLRRARAVFVHSRLLEAEVCGMLGTSPPIWFCPNGVDLDRFRPGADLPVHDGSLRVGWAGSLANFGRQLRGFDDIAAACDRTPGIEFTPAVKEERQRNHAEMAAWHRQNDVYVCFSRCEGTPNAALEAAACGVPVLSTAVGNMPELLRQGENGWLIARQPALLQSTLATIAHGQDRARLATASRRAALAWGWELQAEHFRLLFRAALQAGPMPRPLPQSVAILALAADEAAVRRAARSALAAVSDLGAEVAAATTVGSHDERLQAAAARVQAPWLLVVYAEVAATLLRAALAAANQGAVLVLPSAAGNAKQPAFALVARSALRSFGSDRSASAISLHWQAQAAWLEARGDQVVRLPVAVT